MAKEGSVAPKERINIVYRPATGDAREEIELPLKMMVMGDFTMREEEAPLEERAPINVDKDNFEEVMRKQNLNLSVNVPDRLSGQPGEEMAAHLRFDTLKDFSPESIARQVPELARLMELRDALSFLKGPLGNVPAFRKHIQSILEDPDAREKLMAELKRDES
jgi:type VI secretion system protein ImpB